MFAENGEDVPIFRSLEGGWGDTPHFDFRPGPVVEGAGMTKTPFTLVHEIVRSIPAGRVATYGQIARMLDGRYSPLWVGWALRAAPEDVPWHRVINSKGGISTRQVLGYAPNLQKNLLEAEGVVFDDRERCDLDQFQWDGGALD